MMLLKSDVWLQAMIFFELFPHSYNLVLATNHFICHLSPFKRDKLYEIFFKKYYCFIYATGHVPSWRISYPEPSFGYRHIFLFKNEKKKKMYL